MQFQSMWYTAGQYGPVVEDLPSMFGVMGSILNATEQKKNPLIIKTPNSWYLCRENFSQPAPIPSPHTAAHYSQRMQNLEVWHGPPRKEHGQCIARTPSATALRGVLEGKCLAWELGAVSITSSSSYSSLPPKNNSFSRKPRRKTMFNDGP